MMSYFGRRNLSRKRCFLLVPVCSPGRLSTAQVASSQPTAVQSASPSSGFSTASATPLPSSYSAGSFPNPNLLYIQWSVTLGSRMPPGRHLSVTAFPSTRDSAVPPSSKERTLVSSVSTAPQLRVCHLASHSHALSINI